MKKLSLNISILLFILIVISILLHRFVYAPLKLQNWYESDKLIFEKRNQLVQSSKNYNTLLIGSSRVYRQLNPVILDSITMGKAATKTYNFGVNWLFPPESFFVYDKLIKAEKLKFEYVIIELSKIRSVDYQNLHTNRTIYFYNYSNFKFTIQAVLASEISLQQKAALCGIHLISYIDKLINLGYLSAVLSHHEFDVLDSDIISSSGFVALNENESKTNILNENAGGRRKAFLNDTTVVTKRKESSIRQFQKFDDHPELLLHYNKFYAKVLNQMIASAAKKGITLIFLLSPRIDEPQYKQLIPLYNQIHPDHRIEVSDARKYPELYLTENTFDETHLNAGGAAVYSKLVAEKLNELKDKFHK